MKILWKVRFFNTWIHAYSNRLLYLDTETLSSPLKEAIERELNAHNSHCVLQHRGLFQEVEMSTLDGLSRGSVTAMVITIPGYREDRYGEELFFQDEFLNSHVKATLKRLDDFDRIGLHPIITLKTLIVPCDKTREDLLLQSVSFAWFLMVRCLTENPDILHEIDCWKWEEIVAGAYERAGWDKVILTPKKGDKGPDVIAERAGVGELRHLGLGPLRCVDQVKAHSEANQVGPDVIREMKEGWAEERNATKAIITTTSTFSKGAIEAAANFSPGRIELRDVKKLIEWLQHLVHRSTLS